MVLALEAAATTVLVAFPLRGCGSVIGRMLPRPVTEALEEVLPEGKASTIGDGV